MNIRAIKDALQAHLEQSATTTCKLLKITTKDGDVFGLTTLDQDVVYDGVTYSAENGFDPSEIATDLSISVDNAEGRGFIAAEIPGLTTEKIQAGVLDDAEWEMLLIDWSDHTKWHITIDSGDIGEVSIVDDVLFLPELLSYTMRLRQPIGHVWSVTCRAIFGSGDPDSSDIVEGQTSCGVDAEALFVSGIVTGTEQDSSGDSDEPRRLFSDFSLAGTSALDPEPIPGRVRWTSGNNSSDRLYQVESYDTETGAIALMEPTPFDIELFDEFEIRPDCNKTPAACTAYDNWENYRGEPLIPVADSAEVSTPNAETDTEETTLVGIISTSLWES